MKDRFYNGFIAGFIATLTPIIINFGSIGLGLSTTLWSDFMSLLVSGKTLTNTLETLFFLGLQFVFLGVLGGIFALIIPSVTSQHLLFKGAVFGASSMIVFFSIPHLFHLPQLSSFSLETIATHLISSILWGITTAFLLQIMDKRPVQ